MLPKQETRQFYQIALSFVSGVGIKTVRTLLRYYETAEDIFRASPRELKSIEGMGEVKAKLFRSAEILARAEKELKFIQEQNARVLFVNDTGYPGRLLNCEDAPVLLYCKGSAVLDKSRVIAVIGTRKHTDYGQRVTEDLISGLEGKEDTLVISGLALGIDTIAHKSSLRVNIPTVGVMGHGLDRIYPYSNKALSGEMLQQGALLTEFPSGTRPDRQNFPVRNRVVAGMSDVTVIVESDVKGGAMITAYIAHSYNREIAAFPGRVSDSRSSGPNLLIRRNIAAMIRHTDDLLELMNWDTGQNRKVRQQRLFPDLSPEEQCICDLLAAKDSLHADELLLKTGFTSPLLAAVLLQMEMRDLVRALPGKHYRLN